MYCSINRSCKQQMNKLLMLIWMVASLATANAQNINKPNKMGPLGTEVNTFTGNLFIPRNDIYVPARGFDIVVAFNYNSFNFDQNNGFGNGWSFGYSIKYKNDTANSRTIIWGDGREDNYTVLSGGYKSPKGFFDTLTQYQPDKYLLTEPDGTKFYFDNSTHKRITKMQEPNGNYINFNYADTLLTSLVNTAGQSISFTYNSAGRLATAVDAIASPTRTYTYTYNGNGNLTQVTDPLGGTNKYSYLVNGPMKTITDKNNNTVDIIYYNDFSVSELIGCNKRVSFSYDTATNVTIVTDHLTAGNNQVTKYGYKKMNGQVWLSSLTSNCCGFNMGFEFDDNGNKIKETDANGNAYNYTYDARGNMLTMKDPLNQTSTYTYSPNYNRLTSFTDPKGFIYTMTYDANGNLVQLTEPGNNIYTATYNSNGDISSSTDPRGDIYTYSFDVYGNPVSVSGPNGYHATLANDARGNLLSFTDARNNTHTAQYDILNRLKKITDPLNNDLQINYDAEGNAIALINENNETSVLNYDASNRVVKFIDPMGHQTQMSYDGMDNLIAAKNALGNTVSFTYDTRNRLSHAKDALDNSNNIDYDPNGNITSLHLPNGESVAYIYDHLNRISGISDINGTIGTYTYDKNNNITSYTNGTGAIISATYDSLDRVTKITDPLGFSIRLSYDKNNNIVSATDRNGAVINYTYDSLDRVKTYTDKNGFVITLGYDAAGNVTLAKDQNNNITSYTYDSLNRLKIITYPDSRFMQYGYDKKNNIISKRLTDGTTISYQYDSLNRVIIKTLPRGVVYSYGYDALSRIISATNNNGTVAITYDVLNRITSETFDGRTTRYNYNIAGRTQTTIYPDSTTITKNFDTRNRLTSIAKNNITLVSYQYNNANQVTVKNFANGVSTNKQYDFANRLSSISTAGGSIQNSSFTYDKERNTTSITRLNSPALSEQFDYDTGHRLINYKRGMIGGTPTIQNTYSFDAVGNRTNANLNGINTTYTSNNLNQLTNSNNGAQNINFIYDNNGNLTYDGSFYKTYDAEGRLLKDSSSPSNVLSYQYDAFNRRVQKNFNGTPYKYSYSGLAQIEERDGITNNLIDRTVFTNFLSPVLNELNSVEAITNSSGNLTERYQYDVYGKPIIYGSSNNVIPSSLAGNRFGYTGQEYDSANGNYRFHFRNYSPTTGTFNQRDLIGYADGMGMYQYVHDNPANGIDIFGLQDCPPDENKKTQVTTMQSVEVLETLGSNYTTTLSLINQLRTELGEARFNKIMKLEGLIDAARSAGNFEKVGALLKESNQIVDNLKALEGLGSGLGKLGFGLTAIDALIKGNTLGNVLNDPNAGGTEIAKASGDLGQSLLGFSGIGSVYNLLDFAQEKLISGKSMNDLSAEYGQNLGSNDVNQQQEEEEAERQRKNGTFEKWWKIRRQQNLRDAQRKRNSDCPPNGGSGGTQINKPKTPGTTGSSTAFAPKDPNEIIGPDGQPNKHWVSVHDRLPYTILYENDSTANAPARFVRVTSSMEPKQDAATFQLGSFGFNNQTFAVPPGSASYYQRLDCRDSLGLYVDIIAGYDQINNVAFWEFQSIDPITLLPPPDPLKGFLLLQDSTRPLYGHGFVNFSIKPIQSAVTLDTIGARAAIVFDFNDTIPTNIAMNTIDAFAPTSHMNALPANSTNPVTLGWSGADDTGGCGLKFYTLYVSADGINFNMVRSGITRTDTTFTGAANTTYYFFVLATDSVGNTETLRQGEVRSTFIGNGSLPVTWLYFKGTNLGNDNLLEWATGSEQNTREFIIERSLNGIGFSDIGSKAAAGNSSITTNYNYTDHNVDRLNSPVLFYRLRQVDMDAHFTYSSIIRLTVNNKSLQTSIVYPNPTQGSITIVVGEKTLIGTQAVLFDESGRMLQNIKITATAQTFDLGRYVNGIYLIRLDNKEVLRVVKQ
jgi:RHS repeat-associated protein